MGYSKFKKLVLLHEELLKRGKKLCYRCFELKKLKEYYSITRTMCSICELEYYHKKSKAYRKRLGLKKNPYRIINT